MLDIDDVWLDDDSRRQEAFEVFTILELRRNLEQPLEDDEAGLRKVLYRPDVMSRMWRADAAGRARRPKRSRRSQSLPPAA